MRTLGKLSIIVPCFNEQETLASTHQRLSHILKSCVAERKCEAFEIVYVNDGSTDQTQRELEKLFGQDNQVRIIELRRNFGLQGAISAGLAYAQGDAAITIDADLQDPPEAIPEMITRYKEGYDLVLGVRSDRSSDTFIKRKTAELYYGLLRFLGAEIVPHHGDFRLMARALVEEYNQLTERNRFMRGLVLQLDSHYATVAYKREPRKLGYSKFNFTKMLGFSWDGIVSFTYMPLRLVSILGLMICVLAFSGFIWVLNCKFFGYVVPGWASTILPIFAFSGIQTLILGIMGEYIGRLYVEVKQRPMFSVRREHKH